MSQQLLAFDTDQIKDYVFATGALRDIRGASALLDRLNRDSTVRTVARCAPGAEMVYAQGGSALFVVDSAHTDVSLRAIERLYRDETDTAGITGVAVDLPAAFDGRANIQSYMRQLNYRLRAAKDRTDPWQAAASHGLFRPCEACGIGYATEQWQGPEEQQMQLCRGCARKRAEDRRIRNHQIPEWVANKALNATPADPLWQRLIASLREHGYPLTAGLNRPSDFTTLGEASSPKGYFGLIYADGDSMGRKLEQLQTLEELRHFAVTVDQAVYDSAVAAIRTHLPPDPNGGYLDFDLLLLGGDDLVMVTTAQTAVETALTLVETFSELATERLGPRLVERFGGPPSLTASVVLSHSEFPFDSLRRMAESGLQFAKRRGVERRRAGEILPSGLVNFLAISSAVQLDFDAYYQTTLSARPPSSAMPLDRTLRPYAPAELRQLLAGIRDLSGAPSNKLQQLREACFLGYDAACLEALAALMRWPASRGKREAQELVHAFAKARGSTDVQFPWFLDGDRWRTPLVDVTELFDFVQRWEGNDAGASGAL